MKYTVKNFRYTQQGWIADVMCDNASLPLSLRLDEVNAQDCHNFHQAYITVSCLPYGPHFGYQMDVKEPEFVETEMSLIDRVHMVHGEAQEVKS